MPFLNPQGKFYGFQYVTKSAEKMEQALSEALHIRKTIQDLAGTKDKAILLSQGIDLQGPRI